MTLSTRRLVLGTLLPSLLIDVGLGAMLPVVVTTAVGFGASLALAGLLVSLVAVGQVLAGLPAGALAGRLGDRVAMLVAGSMATLGFLVCALARNTTTLALAITALGGALAVFGLARHSYLTEVTPPERRARVLSTLAGVHRIGLFLGPFAGAAVLRFSDVKAVYLLSAGMAACAVLVLLAFRDQPSAPAGVESSPNATTARVRVLDLLRSHRSLLTGLGAAVVLFSAVRGVRIAVLPLWSEYLGFDPATVSVVFGIAAGLDMLLFYPAGAIMDRWGRLWIGVPSMLMMSLALIALPFCDTVGAVSIAAAVLGIGNGLGTGLLLTLGADVSPVRGRPQFLGIWRIFQDGGLAVGPLALSALAAVGPVAFGITACGAGGLVGAAVLGRLVNRWSVHATRRTRRRAGLEPDGTHGPPETGSTS